MLIFPSGPGPRRGSQRHGGSRFPVTSLRTTQFTSPLASRSSKLTPIQHPSSTELPRRNKTFAHSSALLQPFGRIISHCKPSPNPGHLLMRWCCTLQGAHAGDPPWGRASNLLSRRKVLVRTIFPLLPFTQALLHHAFLGFEPKWSLLLAWG